MTFKKSILLFSFLSVVLAFQNCGKQKAQQDSSQPSSVAEDRFSAEAIKNANFTWINENIVQEKCVSCHYIDIEFGGFNFETYAGVKASIIDGEPENSVFYTRSFSTKFFVLSSLERETIAAWIYFGALNN